ncbi:MAG TPA: hypothetical protein VMV69_19250 [Pirellulales bacterium]|nr:hypothetical protein [Pirellulales bacterium]
MSVPLVAIPAIRELLASGESADTALTTFGEPSRLGLWSLEAATGRFLATAALVRLAGPLPNVDESVAAVFTCEPTLRTAWTGIAAARLKEIGKRRDAAELCRAIDQLGEASRRIREELPSASLRPTGHQALETALFGAAAEQAVVWPKLLRAIGATADLVEGRLGSHAAPPPSFDPLDPRRSWCSGRLLQLASTASTDGKPMFVLRGDYSRLATGEEVASDSRAQAVMRWVLYRPWIMLLAQVVFAQEAWEAEQISGGLSLELGDDQLASAYEPNRVDVTVTTPDGDEIVCGTLGDLLRRVLARLDVTLLARPEDVERLDERLSGVVHRLLEAGVWRFEPRAAGGRRPGYMIGEEFSTSCYRTFGSKYFYRRGSVLTAAIRQVAEQWARERLSAARRVAAMAEV